MTIGILLEALEMLKSHGEHPDYKQQAIHDSICELLRLKGSLPDYHSDIWNGAIHVIHMTTAIDIQNTLLYDEFGKLANSKSNKEVSFGEYMDMAKRQYGFEATSTQFLMSGYEVINDLWHDNEANGCNYNDGTLCRSESDTGREVAELIRHAENFIQAFKSDQTSYDEIKYRGKVLADEIVELKSDLLTMFE